MKSSFFVLMVLAVATVGQGQDKRPPAEKTDIVVGGRTLVQRCVLKGSGLSRVVAVGVPGGFNYAFHAQTCAPFTTWSGGFLDMAGETNARGGNGCKALGVQQSFGADPVPLRVGTAEMMPDAIRFQGYRRDATTGEPTFLFEVDGVSVEQKIVSPKPYVVAMNFTFPKRDGRRLFYLLDPTPHLQVALGKGLKWSGPGVIEISPEQSTAHIRIHLKPTDKTFVREVEQLTGAELFQNFCSACHSIDGTKLIGPSFKDLWHREQVVMRGGKEETVAIDANYVRESILKPQAAIVKGYEAVPMADFSAVLTKEQIESLLEYLRELE